MSNREFDENGITDSECYDITGETSKSMIWSILALVFGILSIIACPLYVVGMTLGALSFILSLISRKKNGFFTRTAVLSLILSIVGFVFGAFSMAVSLTGLFGA